VDLNDPPVIPAGCVGLPPLRPSSGPPPRTARAPAADPKTKGRRKAGDRFAVANAFADYGARLVDPTAQAVWWIIWRETKPDGLARISYGRLADCIGRNRRTTIRAVRRLAKAGLLIMVRRGGLAEGASIYRARVTPKPTKHL
jgi:hypothetical protein